uniref:Uncharacterized protein n=1 Tax=Siphoviridae sp. ct5op20 TaxID=2826295 RepID=A0A8S5NRM4_9CAUD|nr:MAG TPA: hypothetical protein [Siphoviridae sp. ct5op20]
MLTQVILISFPLGIRLGHSLTTLLYKITELNKLTLNLVKSNRKSCNGL